MGVAPNPPTLSGFRMSLTQEMFERLAWSAIAYLQGKLAKGQESELYQEAQLRLLAQLKKTKHYFFSYNIKSLFYLIYYQY